MIWAGEILGGELELAGLQGPSLSGLTQAAGTQGFCGFRADNKAGR